MMYDEKECVSRLIQEYNKYGNLAIAVDFDNTLFDTHNLSVNPKPVIELIKACNKAKLSVCLWTSCKTEVELNYKVAITKGLGIKLDCINESPLSPNTIKPFFSILLDDRASLCTSIVTLTKVLDYINKNYKQNEN